MTIFVKAAKTLILRVLKKSIEESIAQDKGMFSGLFRNAELSEKQREFSTELQKKIDAFENKENDKVSLDALKDLVNETDCIVEAYRKTKQCTRGGLNQTLIYINSNLDRFYHALSTKTFNLSDIVDDEDPFSILCAHAIYYFGEHILCPHEENVLHKAVSSATGKVLGPSPIEVRDKKEACLIRHLTECKMRVDGLNKEGADYTRLRKSLVIEQIRAILRENAEICEESKPISTIPIELTFFATAHAKPSMKPSRGRLKVALENALEKIGSMPEVESKSLAGGAAATV